MGNITGLFSTVPLDYFILGGVAAVLFFDTIRSGLGRAAALSLAFPLAAMLVTLLYKAALVGEKIPTSGYAAAIVIGILTFALFFCIRRMGLEWIDGGMGQPIQALFSGVAFACIFAVIWTHTPAFDAIWSFSPHVKTLFSDSFSFYWIFGSLAALAFARG